MSVSMFRAYAEQLESLRAEQTVDLAQASAYPHLKEDSRKTWLDRMIATIKGVIEDEGERLFSWNGVMMGARRLKAKFYDAFGDRAA